MSGGEAGEQTILLGSVFILVQLDLALEHSGCPLAWMATAPSSNIDPPWPSKMLLEPCRRPIL